MNEFANQIGRYLDNEMSSDEAIAFEAIVAADPEKKNELNAHQAARAAIFSVQQAAIKKQLQSRPTSTFKPWYLGLLILVLIGGLILGFSIYRQSDLYLLDQPMASICEEDGGEFRGPDMTRNRTNAIISYCELYFANQYESLRDELSMRLANLPQRDALRMKLSYPLALTFVKLGDIQKAKELLLAIESNGYDYQPEAKKTLKGLDSFWRR